MPIAISGRIRRSRPMVNSMVQWSRQMRTCSKACYIILKIIIHGCNDAVDQNNVYVAAGISSLRGNCVAAGRVTLCARAIAAALGTARKCAEPQLELRLCAECHP